MRPLVSRSEWLAHLLRLPLSAEPPSAPGLVLIQIDGLSHAVLEDGMRRGQMPFLRRLARREHYLLHRFYSGVPSTTAAVQGELFYGVPSVVPGFNYMDCATGELVRMFEPTAAARVERELMAAGEPLLRGGSCYVNNFTGGAEEPHFCPSALGWGPALREASPLAAGIVMANPISLLRAAALMVLEVGLAVVDGARGVLEGHSILQELKFVPSRVVIGILLRELAEAGAKIDVARGVPIIHVNFLGYDEHAHRRGPSSAFARWSLKGIDDAIRRVWGAAHRSRRRHYDVWIYSDHGQEAVVPYHRVFGRICAEAIAEVFSEQLGGPIRYRSSGEAGAQLVRARLLNAKRRGPAIADELGADDDAPLLTVAPLGPVALIYYDRVLDGAERDDMAKALIGRARLPMLLAREGAAGARAWTADGSFALPEEGRRVFGADHPFVDSVVRDMVGLCHHPNVGTFIACGWHGGNKEYITFAKENGAHGGAGPHETAAFALLPADAPLADPHDGEPLRPCHLRSAALTFLGREEKAAARKPERVPAPETLRLMTYNVHSCIGMDGRLVPERIARVISRYNVDVVALQELDVGRGRTESIDQAHRIAELLDMRFHFHPAISVAEERYGDAVLTHLPMRLVKTGILPGLEGRWREPRGALWVAIDVGGVEVHVINTHLSLTERNRRLQIAKLLGPEWLSHPDRTGPAILCGDFNALPSSEVCRAIRRQLKDAQFELAGHRARGTFFGRFAAIRIDHVFIDSVFEVADVEVPNTTLTRVASDHLPLIAELRMPRPTGR